MTLWIDSVIVLFFYFIRFGAYLPFNWSGVFVGFYFCIMSFCWQWSD